MAGASPTSISGLSDLISNQIPTSVSKWMFEIKLYREKAPTPAASTAPGAGAGAGAGDLNFLHTLWFSHHAPNHIVCLVNNTGSVLQGAAQFEVILGAKMQSLWQLRQVVKGEGSAYEMENGEYVVRLANMSVQGTFRGLVVEIEHQAASFEMKEGLDASVDSSKVYGRIREILEGLGVQNGKVLVGPQRNWGKDPFTKLETAWQYVEALQTRP